MNINLSISPANTIINKILVVIFKASTPNTPYAHQEFDPPHSSPRNINFLDADPVSYVVNTYESTGYPTLGTLRHSFIYDPTFKTVGIRPSEFLKMTAGETSYTDSTWSTWEIESIERVGLGTQYNLEDVNYYVSGNDYRRDGFDLVKDGDVFGDEEKFVIRFYPQVTYSTPVVQSSKFFTETIVIDDEIVEDGDVIVDDTYSGKYMLVNCSDLVVNMIFKPISELGDFIMWGIKSNGGNQITVSLTSEGGVDKFLHGGQEMTELILSPGECILMLGDPDNGFIIMSASEGILLGGQIVEGYNGDLACFMNADGSELSRSTYKKLWKAVQAMPAGTVVSDATWNDTTGGQNNKGKFSTGDGFDTFRIPQLYSAGYMVAVDGSTDIPGDFKPWQMGEYKDITGNAAGATVVPSLSYGGGSAPFRERTVNSGQKNEVDRFGIFKLIRF